MTETYIPKQEKRYGLTIWPNGQGLVQCANIKKSFTHTEHTNLKPSQDNSPTQLGLLTSEETVTSKRIIRHNLNMRKHR